MSKDIAIDAIRDAIENRRLAGQAHDKGLDEALKMIKTPITEYPDVQRLIGQMVELQLRVDAIKKQYARDLVAINTFYYPKPVCENQPPEITNGMNACLSCPMRRTCLLLFKDTAIAKCEKGSE